MSEIKETKKDKKITEQDLTELVELKSLIDGELMFHFGYETTSDLERFLKNPDWMEDIDETWRCFSVPDRDLFSVAFEGKAQVVQEGFGKTYRSKILTNPTWRELVIEMFKYNEYTGDLDHSFLEGFSINNDIIELYLGS